MAVMSATSGTTSPPQRFEFLLNAIFTMAPALPVNMRLYAVFLLGSAVFASLARF